MNEEDFPHRCLHDFSADNDDHQPQSSMQQPCTSTSLPLVSLDSCHVKHAMYKAQNVSTADQMLQLFNLSAEHHTTDCCHWCRVSADHRASVCRRAQRKYVCIVAPMVRYSKLPFRLLCRAYGADLCYTPMIIASGFNRSQLARDAEFSTNHLDQPLIAQFGVNDSCELALAAERILGYVAGIDINCGCPQGWAMRDGMGAALIQQPQIISEMITATRSVCKLPISIKIRIHQDIRKTIDLIKQVEQAGVSFITVHGRTPGQRRQPVNTSAIRQIKEIATVPIIANGDVCTHSDITSMIEETQVDGVMSATGILSNPALFSPLHVLPGSGATNATDTPAKVFADYYSLACLYEGRFDVHHHQLMFMLHRALSRGERNKFMSLKSLPEIGEFLRDKGWHPAQQNTGNTEIEYYAEPQVCR